MEREPKMGSIVVYNHKTDTLNEAEGVVRKAFAVIKKKNDVGEFDAPLQSPAIVQQVNKNGTLDLVIFGIEEKTFFKRNVPKDTQKEAYASDPGSWEWPA